jgi:hypothetical protein
MFTGTVLKNYARHRCQSQKQQFELEKPATPGKWTLFFGSAVCVAATLITTRRWFKPVDGTPNIKNQVFAIAVAAAVDAALGVYLTLKKPTVLALWVDGDIDIRILGTLGLGFVASEVKCLVASRGLNAYLDGIFPRGV